MKSLVNILTEQTQELKTEYLKKTKEWASNQLQKNIDRKNRFMNMVAVRYEGQKISPSDIIVSKEEYRKESKFYWNAPSWYFTPEFIERMEKEAENKYKASIDKLANRIEQKELNQDTLEIKTARIGVNIETLISDGIKTVKAWTIIAFGDVQRPHYRYLVK